MQVALAWATKKRHIAIDGKVLCEPKIRSAGYSVKNGQYNTLALSGIPTYQRTTADVRYSHGDGIIPPVPLESQPHFVDTKSVCRTCRDRYNKVVLPAESNNLDDAEPGPTAPPLP